MKKLLYITFATAMLALSSCSDKSEMEGIEESGQINIKANVGEIVEMRSNPLETSGTTFNDGDQVSIEITESGAEQDAKTYTYNATLSKWGVSDSKYLLWTDNSLDYQAYYPVVSGTSCTNFTLPTNQSTTIKIATADYMTSSGTLVKGSGNDATIQFNRQCARVIINIEEFGSQWSNDAVVTGLTIVSGGDNIGSGQTTTADITPYTVGTGVVGDTYTALVIPSTAKSTETFLKLTVNDGGINRSLTYTGIPAFVNSKSYTFNLSIGYDKVDIKSNFQVEDWTTGSTVESQTPVKSAPNIGDYLYNDFDYSSKIIEGRKDDIIGIVSYISEGVTRLAYAVSLDEVAEVAWSINKDTNECSDSEYANTNMSVILSYAQAERQNRFENFPAMDWVDAKNNYSANYGSSFYKTWLLPTIKDLYSIYTNKTAILSAIDKLEITDDEVLKFEATYWSSETTDDTMNQESNTWAKAVISAGGTTSIYKTTNTYNAVAVIPFTY